MPELDGLRALAVGSVLFAHFVPVKYQLALPFGSAGVQLFFVLSGFLITSILLRSKDETLSTSLKNFYARRFLRIFPLYYLALALCAFTGWMSWGEDLHWHVFYMSNVYISKLGHWPDIGGHLWSLSVEEQYYLIWPLVVLLTSKRNLVRITLVAILTSMSLRLAQPWMFPAAKVHVLPFFNLDALGLGGLIACLGPAYVNTLQYRRQWIGIATIMLTLGWAGKGYDIIWSTPVLHLGMVGLFGVVVARCAEGINTSMHGTFLRLRWVRRIGMISYGLYLWHKFVPLMVEGVLDHFHASDMWRNFLLLGHAKGVVFGLSSVVVSVGLSVLVAEMSWRIFELPINRLKRHFA